MTNIIVLAAAVLAELGGPVTAQVDTLISANGRRMGWRTRDPAIAPDGKVWFVGAGGNYIANLDPHTGARSDTRLKKARILTRSSSMTRASSGTPAIATAASGGSIPPPAPSK